MAATAKLKPEPFLALDVREGNTLRFANVEEVLSWIDAERLYWKWAQKNLHAEIAFANHERRDQLFSKLNGAYNEYSKFKANPADQNAQGSAGRHVAEYAASGIVSTTARARFITSLKGLPDGEHVAQAALAAWLGEASIKSDIGAPYNYRHPARQGRTAMVLFDAGIDPKAANVARAAFEEMAADNNQIMADLHATNQTALELLKDAAINTVKDGNAAYTQHGDKVAKLIEEFCSTRDAIIKRLEEAHSRYTTAMELEGPVEYWTEKCRSHKRAAFWWGNALALYALVGTGSLGFLFYLAYDHAYQLALSAENKFNHLLVLMSAAVLAATTIAFWVGRFLQRLYISERHMAIDAKQRVTMAKTYLALASNQKVDEKDRALVLAPLFRPSSDGLIPEDKEADGVAATLARALEKR